MTADVVRLATAVISKTATCPQYQLPPRYMVTISMTYVPPHPTINTPKSALMAGTGIRKRDTAIARTLGITKYANAMLKFENTISAIIWGEEARQTPWGIRSDMICLLTVLPINRFPENIGGARYLVRNKNNPHYRPILHLLRDEGFNRN
jgi:hypothetical protein